MTAFGDASAAYLDARVQARILRQYGIYVPLDAIAKEREIRGAADMSAQWRVEFAAAAAQGRAVIIKESSRIMELITP